MDQVITIFPGISKERFQNCPYTDLYCNFLRQKRKWKMGLEEFGLRRRVHSSTPSMNELYTPWPKCVSRYESKEISQRWEYEYSKIRAIHTLYESIKLRPQEEQNAPLLRALLTDRGLLFPQTRERGCDTFHSMQLSAFAVPRYHAEAAQAKYPTYAECRDRFYKTHSKDIPFISEDKVTSRLELLQAEFDPPWDPYGSRILDERLDGSCPIHLGLG